MKFFSILALSVALVGNVEGSRNPCDQPVLPDSVFLPPGSTPCGVQFSPMNKFFAIIDGCGLSGSPTPAEQADCFKEVQAAVDNKELTPVPNTCEYSERFDEYECSCNKFKCSTYLRKLKKRGLLEEECVDKDYTLDKRVRTWWWLCPKK